MAKARKEHHTTWFDHQARSTTMNSMCRILAAAFMLASSAVLAAPMIGSKYTLVLPSHLPNAVKFHEWTSMARETRDAEPESDNAILMTGEAGTLFFYHSYGPVALA